MITVIQCILIYAIIGVWTLWHDNPIGILKQQVEDDVALRASPEIQKFLFYLLIIFCGVLWPLFYVTCFAFWITKRRK